MLGFTGHRHLLRESTLHSIFVIFRIRIENSKDLYLFSSFKDAQTSYFYTQIFHPYFHKFAYQINLFNIIRSFKYSALKLGCSIQLSLIKYFLPAFLHNLDYSGYRCSHYLIYYQSIQLNLDLVNPTNICNLNSFDWNQFMNRHLN